MPIAAGVGTLITVLVILVIVAVIIAVLRWLFTIR
jgi:hypothetical protein